MNDHLARMIGAQLRAGKPAQRNPEPVTKHRVQGFKAMLSRLLRQHLGDRT